MYMLQYQALNPSTEDCNMKQYYKSDCIPRGLGAELLVTADHFKSYSNGRFYDGICAENPLLKPAVECQSEQS
jgi:hypothetical protein